VGRLGQSHPHDLHRPGITSSYFWSGRGQRNAGSVTASCTDENRDNFLFTHHPLASTSLYPGSAYISSAHTDDRIGSRKRNQFPQIYLTYHDHPLVDRTEHHRLWGTTTRPPPTCSRERFRLITTRSSSSALSPSPCLHTPPTSRSVWVAVILGALLYADTFPTSTSTLTLP